MILLLLANTLAFALSDTTERLEVCLELVKLKFIEEEEALDLFFLTTELEPEMVAYKMTADVVFRCVETFSDEDIQTILQDESYNLTEKHSQLLNFNLDSYRTENDLILTPKQMKFFSSIMKDPETNTQVEEEEQGDLSIFYIAVIISIFVFSMVIVIFSVTKQTKEEKQE